MKRLKFVPFLAFFIFFSCGMEVPESITLKSEGADYQIPFGDSAFKISEKLNCEKVQESFESDGNGISVYEYAPNLTGKNDTNDDILQFVLSYPVSAVELKPSGSGSSPEDFAAVISAMSSFGIDNPVELAEIEGEVDTGISFEDILKSFASGEDSDSSKYDSIVNNIEFSGIKAYAYIKGNNIKDCAYFTGTIKADTGTETVLADSTTRSPARFSPVDTDLDLEKFAEESVIYKGKDKFVTDYSVELDGEAFTNVLNSRPESLKIKYNLKPALYFENAAKRTSFLQNNSSISVQMNIIIVLPIQFNVAQKIEIGDVLDLAGQAMEEDLFKRDDKNDDKVSKFSDLFESGSMSIDYIIADTTGLNFSAEIAASDESNQQILNETLTFEGGKSIYGENGSLNKDAKKKIELSSSEIQKILTSYPFCPKVKMTIEKTNSPIKIMRKSEFGIWAQFSLKTGGSYEVWKK